MRARKRTTLSTLAGLAGAVVAAAVLGAPTSAQAAPEAAYPAPAPQIRVSAASIQAGDAVRLQGRAFMAGEPIGINVHYRNGDGEPCDVHVKGDRRADDEGRFSARIRLDASGYVIIKVTGKESQKTLKVAVRVKDGQMFFDGGGFGGWPNDIFDGTPLGTSPARGHWDGRDRPVGFYGPFRSGWSPFRLRANETTTVAAPEGHKTYGADLIPGILGLTALVGSGWISFRRRRTN